MHQEIKVTEEDINYAEKILLPTNCKFDGERIAFIKNFNTIDLQAVPGSGKTTALLAKLLILELKLPFKDGSGIVVLSHTNTAINEIKTRIQRHCPKLFSYPNFIGTIQSFVDEFLAVPYFVSFFKQKPYRIDNQIYDEAVKKRIIFNLNGFSQQDQKNARNFLFSNKLEYSYRLAYRNNKVCLVSTINGDELKISKPKRGKDWKDFSSTEIEAVEKWLIEFKLSIMESEGVLHFDDAYFLAELYLSEIPQIKTLLQSRFSLVFVDEMQDMDSHQYQLLETIFYDDGNSNSKYQRIGDKNQAIYNSVKVADIWSDRADILRINGSQRLSKPIAQVVQKFAVHADKGFEIVGLNQCNIKPHLLVFDDKNLNNIIPIFAQLVQLNGLADAKDSIKVVCWNVDWKDDDKSRKDPKKLRLEDYFQGYSKDKNKSKHDYDCLKNYLIYYDKSDKTLNSIYKNLVNALLKILRIERIYATDKRHYSSDQLFKAIEVIDYQAYEVLQLNLYYWSIGVIQGNLSDIWVQIKNYVPVFLKIFSKKISPATLTFINNESVVEKAELSQTLPSNIYTHGDLQIEVTSVHSVKGQTHTATLYMESYFQKDGNGENAKSYESERLSDQFLGNQICSFKDRVKQSAKMAYVGFSRPTDLLCVAIHIDRFKKYLNRTSSEVWEIKKIISENQYEDLLTQHTF